MPSSKIDEQLHDYKIDIGITYLENEPIKGVTKIPFYDERYFLISSNQKFKAKKTVAINIHNSVVSSFPVLDVFIHVAAHLTRQGALEVIGTPIDSILKLTNVKPVINQESNQILGSVIYIDNYGNVVTNITDKLFREIGKTRSFTIFARTVKFRKIHQSYSEAIDFNLPKEKREEDGKKLAIFNSAGHLELAVYKSNPLTVGSASSLFGLDYRDPVTIKFD